MYIKKMSGRVNYQRNVAADPIRLLRQYGGIAPGIRKMAQHGEYVREPGAVQMMRKGGRVTRRRMPRRNAKGRFIKG